MSTIIDFEEKEVTDWEDGTLGESEAYAQVSERHDENAINSALDLHPISIRLQKSLIDDLKLIAGHHGLGYQPLMRQILTRFVESEKRLLVSQLTESRARAQDKEREDQVVAPARAACGGAR